VACPLLAVRQGVDRWINQFGLSESSPDELFRQLGAWSLDTKSDAPATARVQSQPRQWQALLGDTFPTKVSQYGLALNVERQPYQVHRPRQLPLPPAAEAEVTKQVASHLAKGYVEIVPTESDDHLPSHYHHQHWEKLPAVQVNVGVRETNDGVELARRLRQTAAHARAGRTSLRASGRSATLGRNKPQSSARFFQETPSEEPQVLRGSRGYVHKVHLDYETQLFVTPKRKQGEWRMCQNLKFWNIDFSEHRRFKLEGATALAAMLQPNDWACIGDLSQAYHQCGIHPQFRRQLRFRWNGVRYQWRVLPFGLRLAPLYWTKLLRPVIAKARALGIRCLLYLDDLIVVGSSKMEAARDWATVAGLMARELGLLFAPAKTETLPMQVFEALGFQWDCRGDSSPRCRLPEPKVKALRRMVQRIHAMQTRGDDPPCRLIARFLGVLESTRMACPEVKRYRGATQWCLSRALRAHGWEGKAHLRPEALTDLQQLLRFLQGDCSTRLQVPVPKLVIQFGADAAKSLQWGAWCKRSQLTLPDGRVLPAVDVETHGPFTAVESESSINVLEGIGQRQGMQALLPAVLLGIPTELLAETAVQCVCDNTTTVSSNNKQRARTNWLQLLLANAIWDELQRRGLDPLRWSTAHLAGVLNVRADRLSRLRFDPRDWSLAGYVFKFLQRQLQVYCSFDLFADRANAQCKRYCSAHTDGAAEFVNAWTRPWATLGATLFAHPPYILIPRVLRRVCEEGISMILITPAWPSQAWWPTLLSLAVAVPALLPTGPHALLPPGYPARRQPWPQRWRMIAWHISGDISEREAWRATRPTGSSTPTSMESLHRRTTPGGGDSATGQSQQDTSIMCSILQGLRHFA